MKKPIGIVIPTFRRSDGRTPFYLFQTLLSIEAQTYSNYRVFLVGDAYDKESELRQVASKFDKITLVNLPKSVEREKYPFGDIKLWSCGGCTAANHGISLALEYGCEYVCHLAHDDWWEANHLETIVKVIEEKQPLFICTVSSYKGTTLPALKLTNEIKKLYPVDGGIIASSVCIKYTDTKLRVMDRFAVEGICSPMDAYLWEQLRNEMKATGKLGYVATTLTCHHDEEGFALRK